MVYGARQGDERNCSLLPLSLGFFGALLSLLCQNFSMVDVVMLLHGHFQPLQRLQPQLRSFFHQHYLGGQEPTPSNIRVSESPGPTGFPLPTCQSTPAVELVGWARSKAPEGCGLT